MLSKNFLILPIFIFIIFISEGLIAQSDTSTTDNLISKYLEEFSQEGLHLDFNPQIPDFVKTMHRSQAKLQSDGPLAYEPRLPTNSSISNLDQVHLLLTLSSDEIKDLIQQSGAFSFGKIDDRGAAEKIVSNALSYILHEQAAAYAKYPWARQERLSFALNQLTNRALKLKSKSGRIYFLIQSLSQRLGLSDRWSEINFLFHSHYDPRTKSIRVDLSSYPEEEIKRLPSFDIKINEPPQSLDILWTLKCIQQLQKNLEELDVPADQMDRVIRALVQVWKNKDAPKLKPASPSNTSPFHSASTVDLYFDDQYSDFNIPKELTNTSSFSISPDQLTNPNLAFEQIQKKCTLASSETRLQWMCWNYFLGQLSRIFGVDINWFQAETEGRTVLNLPKLSLTDSFDPKTLEWINSKSLSKDLNQKIENLFRRMRDFARMNQSDLFLYPEFSQSSITSYPFLKSSPPIQIELQQTSCLFCEMGRIGMELQNQFSREDERWPTDPFELEYSYLYLNSGIQIDFEDAPYDSLQFKDYKNLRPDPRLTRSSLNWRFTQISLREIELPHSASELRDIIFQALNSDYLYEMLMKVFSLYGFDFSPEYRLENSSLNQPLSMKWDIKPYYEKNKEWEFRDHEVQAGYIIVKNLQQLSDDQLSEYFTQFHDSAREELQKKIEDLGNKVFDETQDIETARKAYWSKLNENWRVLAIENLAQDLNTSWGGTETPKLQSFEFQGTIPQIESQSFEKIQTIQGSIQTHLMSLVAQTKYNFDSGNPLVFPVNSFPLEAANGGHDLAIVYISQYKPGDYISLYDSQLDIESKIKDERHLESQAALLLGMLADGQLRPTDLDFEAKEEFNSFLKDVITASSLKRILFDAVQFEIDRQNKDKPWLKKRFMPRYQKSNTGPHVGVPR